MVRMLVRHDVAESASELESAMRRARVTSAPPIWLTTPS